MEKKIAIPRVPFYFVRHGQTDWNITYQELCSQDDIPLNETGVLQATNVCKLLSSLGITKIYSSPLMRAKQTAEIINGHLDVPLEWHEGLSQNSHEQILVAFTQILEPSHNILIVSHGQVYRILLRILNAQAVDPKAKNGGLYFFNPSDSDSDAWTVCAVDK